MNILILAINEVKYKGQINQSLKISLIYFSLASRAENWRFIFLRSFNEFESQIYSNKTREYFREVLSSYDNSNLRSATVMLYSLVICDILYKLQELKDMYNDKVAEQILSEINKSRNAGDKKKKSQWEKELIEHVKEKTDFFDDDVYCNILHLYDHRNLSAHPALNKDYDLFSPNQETVAAHIRNMVEGVFIKPPIYITKIIETLTKDLSDKKNLYVDDYNGLKRYLNNKYFSRMSEKMFAATFRAIWKFVYILTNEDCYANANINNLCLRIMLEIKPNWLLTNIDKNPEFCNIQTNEDTANYIVELCCNVDGLYECFTTDMQTQLETIWRKCEIITYPLHWFKFKTFSDFNEYLHRNTYMYGRRTIGDSVLQRCEKHFISNSRKNDYISFCIEYFGQSASYDSADYRFSEYLFPNISEMTRDQFDKYVEVACSNHQIYGRRQSYNDNTKIVKILIPLLGLKSEDFTESSSFSFNKDLFVNTSTENDNEDNGELPNE